MHVGKEVGLLVVLGVHRVKSALAHHEHDALALVPQFLKVYALAVLAQHVVLLKQGGHLVQRLAVHDVVVHLLVVAQRTVIHMHRPHLYVRTCAVQRDSLRRVLHEVVAVTVDVGSAARTVHVEFHQTPFRALANHESNLHPHILTVLAANAHGLGGLVPVLVLHLFRRAGVHHGLVCRDLEALRTVQATHHVALLVRDVAHLQFHLNRAARRGGILREGLEVDVGFRAVHQLQRLAGPPARLPVHVLEGGLHLAVLPVRGVALAVAPAGGAQLQPEVKGRFLHVDTALGHVDIERVFRRAAHQFHALCALLREAVGVCLGAARHRHVLHLLPVLPHTHRGRGNTCIIHGILEGQLLILSGCQPWGAVVGREDATVLERVLRANQGGTAAGLEDVYVDALASQHQVGAGFHLGHHLHRVAAYAETAHRYRETAVGRAAPGHGGRLILATVHIQGDDLRAGALHSVGNDRAFR